MRLYKIVTKGAVIAMAALPFLVGSQAVCAAEDNTIPLTIGIVSFKECVEGSQVGAAERDNFDNMRKHLESALEEKEKKLSDLATKFNDPDYLDSLSPEAEGKAKEEYRSLSQEMGQLQQQYYQMLNQANYKVVQNLGEHVTRASEKVAKERGLDVVLNDESTFFFGNALNVTKEVIDVMDDIYKQEGNNTAMAKDDSQG